MMRWFTLKFYLLSTLSLISGLHGLAQIPGDFQTKNVSGNWSDFNAWNIRTVANTWVGATALQLPTASSSIYVQSGHTISVDNANAVCNNLNINAAITSKVAFSTANSVLNVKGNMVLFSNAQNCFGSWTAGAKIVFSGSGAQGFTNFSLNSVFGSIEVNKSAGTLTTSSSLRFGSFTLTAGNFTVGVIGNEIQGSSSTSTIVINGGVWTQAINQTKINNAGNINLPIGDLSINSGTMILATTGDVGLRFSTINVTNGGILTFSDQLGNINITTSINVDATSTFNTARSSLTLPASVTFNGLVNYNLNGPQTINAVTYSNLKLSGNGVKLLASGTTTIPANGRLEMSGAVTTSPTLSAGGSNILSVSASGTTLIYSSSLNQTATNNEWKDNFQNVTFNSGSVVSMNSLNKTINGTLTLNTGTLNISTDGTLSLNGPLVSTSGFIGGATSSTLNIIGLTGGVVLLPVPVLSNINLKNLTISGNRILQMNGTSNISMGIVAGAFTIASGATYDNGGESQITGGPALNITGKFINRDKDNFYGVNGAITSGILNLNAGSTVEYALSTGTGAQVVTALANYKNVTFSGIGYKTPSSNFTPSGTVYITGSAILNAVNNNVGDGVTLTNLTMDGGRLLLGTTGTVPMMAGTFNLTGGIVEFASSQLVDQNIKSETYQNIEVSGNNVVISSGNISLNTNGTFTVKTGGVFEMSDNTIKGVLPGLTQTVKVEAGGVFKCGNNEGFNGFTPMLTTNSSIHPNITNIILNPGSTIEYFRGSYQPITNSNNLIYQNLLLSGSGDKKAPVGVLTIQGNLTKSGTSVFVHNSGTVLLNGTSQTFAGLTYNNLILSNSGIKTTSGNSTIVDSIKVNSSTALTLAANDSITLHSDASKTARIGRLNGIITYNGNSKFVAERYISPKRAWRFLSVPVSNAALTFHQAWQENQSRGSSNQTNPSGYGTQITDKVTPTALNGFDYYSPNGPSVKKFDPSTNTWIGINSTGNTIQTAEGLMTFVRGDRTAQGLYATPTSTVLRTNGSLNFGNKPISVSANKFASIGNPFASAIDMRTIERETGVDSVIYIWDPKLTSPLGFGAFQTFTYIGNNYYPVPGGGSYGATNVAYNLIASGQAFLVHGKTSGTGGLFTMKETDKGFSDLPVVFRPSKTLSNNLYSIDADSSVALLDGVLTIVGDDYSNKVDEKDAIKIFNFTENLAIEREEKLLSVEKRHVIVETDTIFYNLTKVKAAPYRFVINADNFINEGIAAFFEDNYLQTKTPVESKGNTFVNFKISSDSGSWNPGRFRLVFEKIEKSPSVVSINSKTITIYPNPIKNGNINLHLTNDEKNDFRVRLLNASGEVVFAKHIEHSQGSITETIKIGKAISKGVYLLEIIDKSSNKTLLHILN